MLRYQRNNIIFRISSASAISKFKQVQAHSFTQLARKEFNFDEGAKEVVLLSYDRFSNWIIRIEKISISVGEQYTPANLKAPFVESFLDELRVIQNVMLSHSNLFYPDLNAYVKLIHDYSAELIPDMITNSMVNSMDTAYAAIVGITSDYLQHILVAMHEYNNNIVHKTKQPPFVSIANFCLNLEYPLLKYTPCLKRLKFFKEAGVGDTFILKNYSDYPEAHSELAELASKTLGITLVNEKNEE